MRMRSKGRDSDFNWNFSQREVTANEIFNTLRLPGRETLESTTAQNGCRLGAEGPDARDATRSGGANDHRNGRTAPTVPTAGVITATGGTESVGNGAGAIHFPSTRVLADDEELADEKAKRESQPTRNQRNYRITDADHV